MRSRCCRIADISPTRASANRGLSDFRNFGRRETYQLFGRTRLPFCRFARGWLKRKLRTAAVNRLSGQVQYENNGKKRYRNITNSHIVSGFSQTVVAILLYEWQMLKYFSENESYISPKAAINSRFWICLIGVIFTMSFKDRSFDSSSRSNRRGG